MVCQSQLLLSSLLWKKKLHLEPCGPAAGAVRALDVAENLAVDIYGLLSEVDDLSNSAPYGDNPAFA